MKIAVKDSNVFIDLESMGILDLWFQLGHETITSSYVVIELEDGGHENALAFIAAGHVREAVISGEEMVEFDALRAACEPMGLSPADVSVLFLARREGAFLLSGDKNLRGQAVLRMIEVHGTLWIMDCLIDAGLLAAPLAAQRLETLLGRTGKKQRYLPKAECFERIARWRRR